MLRLYIVTLFVFFFFFLLIYRVLHAKCQMDEAQARIKIARTNNNNFRYADDTTLMAENEKEAS